jgi:preprotein translocase subunit SecY
MQKRKNKSLVDKIVFTLFVVFILRAGNFIPVPYVDQTYLINIVNANSLLKNFFTNKNIILSIFSVGIGPSINASILIQFLTSSFSYFKKLQKEEGESGRQQIKQYTRVITLIFAIFQSVALTFSLKSIMFVWDFRTISEIVLALTTGSMVVLWLTDLITEYGIGNGSSLMIAINIISALPNILYKLVNLEQNTTSILYVLIFPILVAGIICLQDAVKKIPLVTVSQLYKEKSERTNQVRKMSYIPLKITQGVMPIIFSSTSFAFISVLFNFIGISFVNIAFSNSNLLKILYTVINFVSIVFFSKLYSNLTLNSKEIAKDLNKSGVVIETIRPGQKTRIYLKKTLNRLSLIGGVFLATLVTIPNIFNLPGFSITSLIIFVGVSTELTRQIQILSRQ